MKVKMSEIEKIESQCSDPNKCLLKVLSVRLKQIPSLTWRDIDTALRSGPVGEHLLADGIRRQYGHLYIPDPSFEASLDQEQGRKKSKITKSKKKAKKEKSAKKYMQQDSDEEVSESERYRKPSKRVQMEVNEAVVKKTQQRAKKSPYVKRHSKPGKQYNIEKELIHEGETQRTKKATKYDKESQVVCDSQHRHKVKHSEQRAQEEVQIESESESSASSSEQAIVQGDNSDSTEESNFSEQEEDSAEEVSETERYQKPSEQPREDEYPHSHRETPVRKIKGKRGKKSSDHEKSKYISQSKAEGKAKQKKKAVDQSVSNEASQHEMAGDGHGKCERIARERKQRMSEKHSKKGVQKAPRENESESSAMKREEETVSSLYHRVKSRKIRSAKDTHQQKQSQGKKLEYQTKATAKKEVEKKVKESVSVAGEQSSDEEVREKPTPKSLRQKEIQTKSESEDESSSASTSDDGSELHLHESTRGKEHHKVHPNTDRSEIEKGRDVKTNKKTKVTKQKGCHSSDTNMREQSIGGERCTKVKEKTKKASREKYLKADDTSPRKEREEKKRISSRMKFAEHDVPSSDSTQEDSEDEESDSDDSSEDEEDRDPEQKSSNEEEETEPDDESSSNTSEEEVKRKPVVIDTRERVKETGGRKGKRVKITADVPDLSGDEDQSDPGGRDQEEHEIQPKKRSRRRHRESSMSPTARGSSSPSTSQEENQRQIDSKKQKGKNNKGKDHKKKGKPLTKKEKGEASDSSPECDRSSESEKLRINIFERFYGQLCCDISNPVETAAQLQKKGLVSKALMRDIMRSPISQQEKTINLVDKLDEVIKSKPDCLFTFIETLLENDALQKVGSEIFIEAGKYIVKLMLHSP